jgi:hypothetical protein
MWALKVIDMDSVTPALSRVRFLFNGVLLMFLSGSLLAGEAEDFYNANVHSFVQSKCILCHRAGGIGSANLVFSSSASGNHQAFDNYVNSPIKGAKASRVLSKISGGLGHGGGVQISLGSVDYQAFSDYVNLLSAADPVTYIVQPSASAGGTISPSNDVVVSSDNTTYFTITANEGYELEVVGGTCGGSLSGNIYTTSAVVRDCTVTGTFKPLTSGEDASAFIERFYVNILGRPSDEGGLNAWLNVIQTQSASAVVLGFLNSPEFLAKNLDDAAFVDILYRTLFDREGDAGGSSYWLEQLAAGKLRDMVIWGFLRAAEFKTLSDSFGVTALNAADESAYGIRAFVERFYTLVLGRQPDTGGFDNWVTALTNGSYAGGDIAKAFFLSAEYLSQNTSDDAFVNTCYQAFFGRAADAAGKQGWLDALAQGSSRTDVLNGFIGSAEFAALASSYGIKASRASARMAAGSARMARDAEVQVRDSEEAKPIPVLPLFVLLMLSGLVGLIGIRKLRAVSM